MSRPLEEGVWQAMALEVVGWSRLPYYRCRARFKREGVLGLVSGSRRPCRVRKPQWIRLQERLMACSSASRWWCAFWPRASARRKSARSASSWSPGLTIGPRPITPSASWSICKASNPRRWSPSRLTAEASSWPSSRPLAKDLRSHS